MKRKFDSLTWLHGKRLQLTGAIATQRQVESSCAASTTAWTKGWCQPNPCTCTQPCTIVTPTLGKISRSRSRRAAIKLTLVANAATRLGSALTSLPARSAQQHE